MKQEVFEDIKNKLRNYKYSSMNYCEYEDVHNYNVISDTEELILLCGFNEEAKIYEYHWASNKAVDIINAINRTKCLITFIPHDWVEEFEIAGYTIRNAWHDYIKDSLEDIHDEADSAKYLCMDECKTASEVTMSCRNQSRGFTGQSEQWIKSWMEEKDKFTKNNTILIWQNAGNEIVGIVCTATYGYGREKGPISWIREVAVRPEYQNQGIARKLIKQALSYGKKFGAVRAFLAADEMNVNAIHLYTSIGFKASDEESQIDMIKVLL